MGGCSYPSNATSPISEDQMWNGFPQIESSGYSVAKKLGIVASQSYRKQYGLNSNILIPGNLYGEYDNFKIDESHVIPAMIRRFFECKIEKKKEQSITSVTNNKFKNKVNDIKNGKIKKSLIELTKVFKKK